MVQLGVHILVSAVRCDSEYAVSLFSIATDAAQSADLFIQIPHLVIQILSQRTPPEGKRPFPCPIERSQTLPAELYPTCVWVEAANVPAMAPASAGDHAPGTITTIAHIQQLLSTFCASL